MSKDIPLSKLREMFTVGELVKGEHDDAPTRAPDSKRPSFHFLPPEEQVVEACNKMGVQEMVDRGLISRGELMTAGIPRLDPK